MKLRAFCTHCNWKGLDGLFGFCCESCFGIPYISKAVIQSKKILFFTLNVHLFSSFSRLLSCIELILLKMVVWNRKSSMILKHLTRHGLDHKFVNRFWSAKMPEGAGSHMCKLAIIPIIEIDSTKFAIAAKFLSTLGSFLITRRKPGFCHSV